MLIPDTWINLVASIWPNITEAQCDLLLWETTCFPFGSAEKVEQQLKENYVQSDGNIEKLLAICDAKLRDEVSKSQVWEILSTDHPSSNIG